MVDAPNGGGFLEIETSSKTFVLRSNDSKILHLWRRELYELLPYLRATEVKCGWLLKKGEGSSAAFKKRYCGICHTAPTEPGGTLQTDRVAPSGTL